MGLSCRISGGDEEKPSTQYIIGGWIDICTDKIDIFEKQKKSVQKFAFIGCFLVLILLEIARNLFHHFVHHHDMLTRLIAIVGK